MTEPTKQDLAQLHDRAYEAMDQGALDEASQHFEVLLRHRPDAIHYHYMRGLVHKYLMDWPTSLHHNLRAIELDDKPSDAEHWMPPLQQRRWDNGNRLANYGKLAVSASKREWAPSMTTLAWP
jgi:hypothetical protein